MVEKQILYLFQLPQGFVEDNGNCVGEIQASHPFTHHRDYISLFFIGFQEPLWKAAGLRAEYEEFSILITGLGIGLLGLFRKEEHRAESVFFEKGLPGVVEGEIYVLPVVQACPLEVFVVDLEAQRGDQMKRGPGGSAQSGNGPRIGGDFGLVEDDLHEIEPITS